MMRGLSGVLGIAAVLSFFGGLLSIGLAYLYEVENGAWAPVRTGPFLTKYIPVDLSDISLFDSLGVQAAVRLLLSEPLYKTLFVGALLLVFLAMVTRGIKEG